MLTALPPSVTFYDYTKLTGGDGPRKATPVVPADPPKPVADADPRRWRREGPLPDRNGCPHPDPTGDEACGIRPVEALEAVQRAFTQRTR